MKLNKSHYNYLIIGAGLYGSVLAYELNKRGYKVLVVEKKNHIAGNIYTEKKENIDVHVYGAHIFHTSNKMIWEYVNNFVEFIPFINSPIANYKGELYNMPFNMNTFSKMFEGVITPRDAKRRIEDEIKAANIKEIKNLEDQAISLVGTTVYEKLIKGYTAKQWGKSCDELPSFIIKRLPLRFTFDNNYFNDDYQGIPKDGYTKLVEGMLKDIEVILNTDYFEHKDELNALADKIIFTGPIDQLFDYKYGHLEYRSVRFENELLDEENHQGVAVVNYTDRETPYTRIIEHKHFNKFNKSEKTIISKEYPLPASETSEPYYPINDDRNMNLVKKYLEEKEKYPNIYLGGRLGLYKYLDMDDVIELALNQIEKLI